MFYRVKGFKDSLRNKQEADLLTYFSQLENLRSIYGAGIIDAEDETKVENQSLTNYAEVDTSSLRRVALASGIPLSWLVGEAVQGMNSSGKNEESIFWSMIQTLGNDYILPQVNDALEMMNMEPVEFSDQYQQTPLEKVQYDKVVLENAVMMQGLGMDYDDYIVEKEVIPKEEEGSEFANDFSDPDKEEDEVV